jgi:hypothetical protein
VTEQIETLRDLDSPAPTTSSAILLSAQRPMTPSGYTLFFRNDIVILRALSDDANDGFFNIDRLPNTPDAIEHLRQTGTVLAREANVAFTDFTQTNAAPHTSPAPKKPRKLICLSMTCRAVRHRAMKGGFSLKSRNNAYRLMLGNDVVLTGTLERISAFLAGVHDSPSKTMPPRTQSTTYDAIVKRARRRGYVTRKIGPARYTIMRGGEVIVAGGLTELATYLAANP